MFQRMITAPSTAHLFPYKLHLLRALLFIDKAFQQVAFLPQLIVL